MRVKDLKREGLEAGGDGPVARAHRPSVEAMSVAELLFSARLMALPVVEAVAAEHGGALAPPALPVRVSHCCYENSEVCGECQLAKRKWKSLRCRQMNSYSKKEFLDFF